MRPRLLGLILVAAFACGGERTEAPATPAATATPSPVATAAVSLAVALNDPEVQLVLKTWGGQGTPFAAFRGTQAQFQALGCRFYEGARPDRVELVVYVRGTFSTPSGKQADTAMVQSLEGGTSVATLYATGASGPAEWCSPP